MSQWTYNSITFSNKDCFNRFFDKYVKEKTDTCWDWYRINLYHIDFEKLCATVQTSHYDSIKEEDVQMLSMEFDCGIKYTWQTSDGCNMDSEIGVFAGNIIYQEERVAEWRSFEVEEICEAMNENDGHNFDIKEIYNFFYGSNESTNNSESPW